MTSKEWTYARACCQVGMRLVVRKTNVDSA